MATTRVLMPPVVDMVNLMFKLKNRGSSFGSLPCKMAIRLISSMQVAPEQIRLQENQMPGVRWYKAGMLYIEFDEKGRTDLNAKAGKIKNINDSAEVHQFLHSMPNTLVPLGMVTVAIPSDFEVPETASDFWLQGRLYQGTGDDTTTLYMAKAVCQNNQFYVDGCGWDPLSIVAKTLEQAVLYANIVFSQTMNNVLPKLKVGNAAVTRAGIDKCILNDTLEPVKVVRWSVDSKSYKYESHVNADDLNVEVAVEIAPPEVLNTGESWETYIPTEIKSREVDDPTKGVRVSKGRTYYNREKFYENNQFIDYLSSKLETAEGKVLLKKMELSDYKDESLDILFKKAEDYLKLHWDRTMATCVSEQYARRKPMQTLNGVAVQGTTSNMLMKGILLKAYKWGLLTADTNKGSITEEVAINNEILEYMGYGNRLVKMFRNVDASVADTDLLENLQISLRSWSIIWHLLLVCVILDIDFNFGIMMGTNGDVYSTTFAWLVRNPYDLIFVHDSISIRDMDRLAMFIGVFGNADYEYSRCIAYLHGFMLSGDNIDFMTYVPLKYLKSRFEYGYALTQNENKKLPRKDIAIAGQQYVNAVCYLGINASNFKLTYKNISENKSAKRIVYTRDVDTDEAIENYIKSGYGVRLEFDNLSEGISDFVLLQKEYDIYNLCKILYNAKSECVQEDSEYDEYGGEADVNKLTPETISECIDRFEALKAKELGIAEFKLETKQREAVMMAGSNILALYGGAGTGKTTTSEALLYVLQKIEGIDDSEILFIAPTGKAAVRLREVVKRPTSTIHRALKMGICSKPPKDVFAQYRAIIVDECSMITLDLMHHLIKAINRGTRVYLLGDIAQLLPIGFGKPFANMLRYLPCVTLEVSKRAREGSAITAGANAWLSIDELEPLKSGKDLKLIGASTDEVTDLIIETCKHYLNKSYMLPVGIPDIDIGEYTPDDIQVVTPLKHREYGTIELNRKLREVFNPQKAQSRIFWKTFGDTVEEFRVGDRVIHTDNWAHEIRYIKDDTGYIPVSDVSSEEFIGVMNGDIGTIYEITTTEDIVMYDMFGEKLEPKGYRRNKVVMMVEYRDIDLRSNQVISYYIPYLLSKDTNETDVMLDNYYVLASSMAATSLELAYALTVHKMQGSQAKLPIFVIFAMGKNNTFMCNNLVYTGMTRSQKGLYMFGDVSKPSRMRDIQTSMVLNKRFSVFDAY